MNYIPTEAKTPLPTLLKKISSKWIDTSSEGHIRDFSSKIVNWMRGQRSNKSLILVRNMEESYLCMLYFSQVFSFYLTFDPSFNLQFLKRNLLCVPRKRYLFIWREFIECSISMISAAVSKLGLNCINSHCLMFLMIFVYIAILYRPFRINQKHVLVPAINQIVCLFVLLFFHFGDLVFLTGIIWKINLFAISLLHVLCISGTFSS